MPAGYSRSAFAQLQQLLLCRNKGPSCQKKPEIPNCLCLKYLNNFKILGPD